MNHSRILSLVLAVFVLMSVVPVLGTAAGAESPALLFEESPKGFSGSIGEDGEPSSYLWLTCEQLGVPSPYVCFNVPADGYEPGSVTIRALAWLGEESQGTVYANCYPYAGETLLNWVDYVDAKRDPKGTWLTIEQELDPSQNGVQPDRFQFGIGFWQATGTIKIAYIILEQNGNELWSVDFEHGIDMSAINNMPEEDRGITWGIKGDSGEPEPVLSYKEEILRRVGEEPEDPTFVSSFTCFTDGEYAHFRLKMSGFWAEDWICGIIAPIFYDDERLEPAMEVAGDGSLQILSGLPGESAGVNVWENMSVLFEANDDSDTNAFPGRAHVYLQTVNFGDGSYFCDGDTEIFAELVFRMKEGFDEYGVWMENGTALSMNADFDEGYGKAAACVLDVSGTIASRSTYTVHEFFRMGGADVGWGYDPNAAVTYPDESGRSLTDGRYADSCSYADAAWVGLNQSHPDFINTCNPLYIDFEVDQEYEIGAVRIHLSNLCQDGVSAPLAVRAQTSEDG
ncbi:MAG: hypothetical protein ILO68_01550 [Clostridia bacterium]|nr:hypothetical protein [Clostridia bacterium]